MDPQGFSYILLHELLTFDSFICLFSRKYRYASYRHFVQWCWGYLGKEIRVVLPSCVVAAIRNAFPSEEYEGFQLPPLN